MKKILFISLGFIGLVVVIIGGIVSSNMPNDHGRGDVVCAAVADCLMGIGGGFLIGDALLITASIFDDNSFSSLITVPLIIGGIIAVLGSIIMGVFKAKLEIDDYDEHYGSEAALIAVYDDSENDLLNFQVSGCVFSCRDSSSL